MDLSFSLQEGYDGSSLHYDSLSDNDARREKKPLITPTITPTGENSGLKKKPSVIVIKDDSDEEENSKRKIKQEKIVKEEKENTMDIG